MLDFWLFINILGNIIGYLLLLIIVLAVAIYYICVITHSIYLNHRLNKRKLILMDKCNCFVDEKNCFVKSRSKNITYEFNYLKKISNKEFDKIVEDLTKKE